MTDSLLFEYPILKCRDFDDVLATRGETTTPRELISQALRGGRVLLQAPGGSGKTWTLNQIAYVARADGLRVGFVQVQKLDRTSLEANGVDALLKASEPSLTYEELAGGEQLLLLVDGLSEVGNGTAELVLKAVDQWAALGPSTGTVVADRMVRRPIRPPRWQLATLGPVPYKTIKALAGYHEGLGVQTLLQSPLYLLAALKSPEARLANQSEAIRGLLGRADLAPHDWERIEDAALTVYQEWQRRSFSRAWFSSSVGSSQSEALTKAGVLLDVGQGEVCFSHHLMHDYLAARAASRLSTEWGHGLFSALTLSGSSHDALVILLEQLHGDARASLIRSVYDWNLYAASYLLSRDRQVRGETDETTEQEILALLGERRFDHFLGTRRQVEDALLLHGGKVAAAYLQAASVQGVLDIAKGCARENSSYRDWLITFLYDERPSPNRLIARMQEVDGVDGWTATNVIRRLGLDLRGRQAIEELATNSASVVRWRCVHALGVAGPTVLSTLFKALSDDVQGEVRFGALRSIVEQAYLSPNKRGTLEIFRHLATHARQILDEPALSREFARVLEVHDPPVYWAEAASSVLEAIIALEPDPSELDRWRNVGSNLRIESTVA